ncbi:ankyrin [Desulfobulbus alkaliphilus]|uniref:ankyrin n=1 Tax=Desulfobulbus alkaliphilus TaxID=869814 RepID=UPI0019632B99|nr:ankyrin [Desulfobulbus alkaliphilus]MBM9536819.1 ankyrin [Desulfobulbus alkaliphilus]
MSKETKKRPCPTCMGTGVIPGVCETSGEWQAKTPDGQICTPDANCPTCKGKGYVED